MAWAMRTLSCLLALCIPLALAGPASAEVPTGTLTQEVSVSWSGGAWSGHDESGFVIPSVGSGEVLCRPNATWVRMIPANPDAENDMWGVKFETKPDGLETAVKDARVYEFSTPVSTVPHGTGPSAYEGFNQDAPVEEADSGHMLGIISSRAALDEPAGQGSTSTAFTLSWAWTGFGTPSAQCTVRATLTTEIAGASATIRESPHRPPRRVATSPLSASSLALDWHGEADEPAAEARPRTLLLPGIGSLTAQCLPLPQGGTLDVALTPLAGLAPGALVTTYQGEGTEASTTLPYYSDPLTSELGPVALPVNGVTTMQVTAGELSAEVVLSSYAKLNDPEAADDYCEVSGASLGG
jgi:hypothetical protein